MPLTNYLKNNPHIILFSCLVFTLLSCRSNNNNQEVKAEKPSNSALFNKYHLDKISLLPGFNINVFAEVPNARSMCFGTKGTLFVGNLGGGSVYAAVDNNKDGVADTVYTIASGLNTPCGVAFKDGNLYVAEISRILRFDNIESNLAHPAPYKVIYDHFPSETHHGWKFIAFGPDGKLYVPVGAPCNVCSVDSMHGVVTRMNPDGTGLEVFAKGIRNTVGFDWNPDNKDMWFTDNGRDEMGDDIPNDELNVASAKGMHFGFPYCFQGDIPDPEFGKGKSCSDFVPPVLKLGPHVASLGLRFYKGDMFPDKFKNAVFIAEHGSWNRTKPIGYRVMLVRLKDNKPAEYIPFADGWLQSDGTVNGRPADVQVAPDGALLISDDKSGAIYRISVKK